ncbi:MAG: zinc ribbon domain-containing protein [Clostridia bacterium]|nr:zinc ribbon domain-containing protein [Clostridia bacterium]
MYCKHCGKQINDDMSFCPYCGGSINGQAPVQAQPTEVDAPNMGYAVLGFLIPIVGLILYLIWKDQFPLRAKSAGKGALVALIVNIVFGFLFVIFYVILVAAAISSQASTAVATLPLFLL